MFLIKPAVLCWPEMANSQSESVTGREGDFGECSVKVSKQKAKNHRASPRRRGSGTVGRSRDHPDGC